MTLPFPKPKGRTRNTPYMLAVKRLPCLGWSVDPHHACKPGDAIDAAHQGDHHMRRKSHDTETVPLCHTLHMQQHALAGPWKGWYRERMRAWRFWAIKHTQAQMRALGWEV